MNKMSFQVKISSGETQIFLCYYSHFLYKQEDYCISLHSYSAPQSETSLNQPKGNESQGVVEYHSYNTDNKQEAWKLGFT